MRACVCCCCCMYAQSCPTLFNPMNYNLPDSSVHGISQARTGILELVAILSTRGSSWPRDRTWVSCIAGWFFTTCEALYVCVCVCIYIYMCVCVCVCVCVFAISFSRGTSQPRDQTQVSRIVGRRFTVWATREALCIYISQLNYLVLGMMVRTTVLGISVY